MLGRPWTRRRPTAIWALPLLLVALMAPVACAVRPGRVSGQTALFRTIRPSLALISTPSSTGSSELVEGGYLVTNAHVVDPYERVDVQFPGHDTIRGVRVVGVDLVADIAVVGPVHVSVPPLRLEAPVRTSGRAYLMGFPGDQWTAEAKVTHGRLAGTRPAPGWGLDYVASTTPIAGGQSGGALVDAEGRVIGVSALETEEGTALSLRGDQAMRSVRRILAGRGSPWESEPNPPTKRTFTVPSEGPYEVSAFHLPPAEADRTITIEAEASDGRPPLVAVGKARMASAPTRANEAVLAAGEDTWWTTEGTKPLRSAGPGAWRFDLPAYGERIVTVAGQGEGGTVSVTLSDPVAPVRVDDPMRTLEVPGRARGYIDAFDDAVPFQVHLDAGETVRIAARTPSGDAEWQVAADSLDALADDGRYVVDGGGGLFRSDAVGNFTPQTTGWYDLWVFDADETATAVEVRITRP